MTQGSDRREATKELARRFADHLRHLREFHGVRYVRATPSPRGIAAGPEGQVSGDADSSWSSGQASAPARDDARPTRGEAEARRDDAPRREVAAPAAAPRQATPSASPAQREPAWAAGSSVAPREGARAAGPSATNSSPREPWREAPGGPSSSREPWREAPGGPSSSREARAPGPASPRAAAPPREAARMEAPRREEPDTASWDEGPPPVWDEGPPPGWDESEPVWDDSPAAPRSQPSRAQPSPASRDVAPPPRSPPREAPRGGSAAPQREAPRGAPPPTQREAPRGGSAAPQPTRAPTRLPIAEPAGLPGLAEPVAPQPAGGDGLRSQAQAWTAAEKLAYLRSKNVGQCTRCKLAKTRTNIVFGVGSAEARLMFVGEAPGADEDRTGEPFVGAAGRRLTQWIERLGMKREQVYIANVLKCRPPGNRNPEADEIARCSPFLQAQIRAIRPAVIVALGRYAGMFLLGAKDELKLKDMRARSWTYEDAGAGLKIPLHVTYHPSYVIRQEGELSPGQRNYADDTVMSDLTKAMRVLLAR